MLRFTQRWCEYDNTWEYHEPVFATDLIYSNIPNSF